jgi:integrase
MALTKRQVRDARPRTSAYVLWDSGTKGVPGFGLRVLPSGTKMWVLKYRTVAGRQRWHTLGRAGVMKLEDARGEAADLVGAIRKGGDPVADGHESKHRARHASDVAELTQRYLSHRAGVRCRLRTVAEYRRLLEKHAVPAWGTRLATEICRADVARLHEDLREKPYLANRVLAVVRAMFSYAEQVGIVPEGGNPCRGIKPYKERQRQAMLTPAELKSLGEALICLLLTGCRKTEITHARWEWIDWVRRVLVLPDAKTGGRSVRLGAPALQLLEEEHQSRASDWICPGRNLDGPFIGLQKSWERIRKEAGLDEVRIHDLRHTMASIAAQGGQGLPVIGALLGHVRATTTARYTHTYEDPVRAAADTVAKEIDKMLKGKKAKVVRISR